MRRFSPAPTGGKAKSGCKGTKKKGKEKEKSKKIASAAIKKTFSLLVREKYCNFAAALKQGYLWPRPTRAEGPPLVNPL